MNRQNTPTTAARAESLYLSRPPKVIQSIGGGNDLDEIPDVAPKPRSKALPSPLSNTSTDSETNVPHYTVDELIAGIKYEQFLVWKNGLPMNWPADLNKPVDWLRREFDKLQRAFVRFSDRLEKAREEDAAQLKRTNEPNNPTKESLVLAQDPNISQASQLPLQLYDICQSYVSQRKRDIYSDETLNANIDGNIEQLIEN